MAARRFFSAAARAPELIMLFDSSCPLCAREVAFLATRRRAHLVKFEDITAPGFSAAPFSRSVEELARELHVFLPATRELHARVPAFRRLYATLFGADLLFFTQFFPFNAAADRAYSFFLRHRHRLARLLA
jgi:predicted DCC family thiol-disulfide oxidoreductase YuxK